MALDPTKHADWEIAEDSEKSMRPITEIAEKMGLNKDELLLHGHHIAKVDFKKVLKRFEGQAGRQVHRGHGHHAHAARRRQVHHHHGADPGPGQARQERDRRDPPAFGRPDHEHQGLGGRRRPCAVHPAHAVLPGPHRRHQRHHERPQPGHGGADLPDAARVQLRRRAAGQDAD